MSSSLRRLCGGEEEHQVTGDLFTRTLSDMGAAYPESPVEKQLSLSLTLISASIAASNVITNLLRTLV
jgi:hypothetical protein